MATETLATFGGELEIWATTARAIDTDEVWVATCWGREVAWLTKAIKSEVVPTDKIDKDAHKTDVVKISVSLGAAATQEHRETQTPRCWPYLVLAKTKDACNSQPGDEFALNCDNGMPGANDHLVSSYIKANTSHACKIPAALQWSIGSPPLSSSLMPADFETWWENVKSALEKASIESVETGASEILRRWDFESLASGDKQVHSGDADLLVKNIEYIKKCMCWVPSQTGVGSWRVITKDLAKNKTHHGAAATKCCGRSLNDKIMQSIDSATGLPNKVPCPP